MSEAQAIMDLVCARMEPISEESTVGEAMHALTGVDPEEWIKLMHGAIRVALGSADMETLVDPVQMAAHCITVGVQVGIAAEWRRERSS